MEQLTRPQKEDFCKGNITEVGFKPDWSTFDMNAYSIAQEEYLDYLESLHQEPSSIDLFKKFWQQVGYFQNGETIVKVLEWNSCKYDTKAGQRTTCVLSLTNFQEPDTPVEKHFQPFTGEKLGRIKYDEEANELEFIPVEKEEPKYSIEDSEINDFNELLDFINGDRIEVKFYGNDGFDNQEEVNGVPYLDLWIRACIAKESEPSQRIKELEDMLTKCRNYIASLSRHHPHVADMALHRDIIETLINQTKNNE